MYEMAEFISLYNSVIGQVTEKHLEIFKTNVDKRKEIIQYAYEAKQQQYIDKLALTKERIANVEKRRRIDNLKLSAKRKSAHEKFLVRLDLRREFEFYKKLTLAANLKKRDKDKAEKLAKFKQRILHRKHKNEIKRYMVIYDRQKSTIKQNNALIDKCFEETVSDETVSLEEINEIEEEVEIEPESSKDCSFHQVREIKINIYIYDLQFKFRILTLLFPAYSFLWRIQTFHSMTIFNILKLNSFSLDFYSELLSL